MIYDDNRPLKVKANEAYLRGLFLGTLSGLYTSLDMHGKGAVDFVLQRVTVIDEENADIMAECARQDSLRVKGIS